MSKEFFMEIRAVAISLNVADVAASAEFAKTYFGFTEAMAADGPLAPGASQRAPASEERTVGAGTRTFVSLEHPTAGVNVIFLATGLPTFKPEEIAGAAGQGLLLVLVVTDIDAEHERIAAAGARVITPPQTEPWGERFSQYADPNGIVWQLVQWVQ